MDAEFRNVAIVGTGLIGSAWAAFLASRRCVVNLFDHQPAALREGYSRAVDQLEFLTQRFPEAASSSEVAAARLTIANTLEDAAADADLVIEAVPERYDVKTALFAELDRITRSRCVLASSTSGLSMTRIQKNLVHPERTLIAHPFNPVHLVPLVEIVAGQQTEPSLLTRMQRFLDGLGKTAIIVRREVPGFIGNRLQAAVWREAIQLVLDGVGSVEDVDRALTSGPGLRWALMGAHLTFHLGGGTGGIGNFVDHIGGQWQSLWEDMANWTELPVDARASLVDGIDGELKDRSAAEVESWRDLRLAEILRVLQADEDRNAPSDF